ncbi:MAG: tRNA (adenosine(37)-N6)-threonylcarbamoyltransferase complex transferase subunit TsaD [Desulfovibrionaceae bacterium]
MRCLGIETSCDETALALVDNGRLLGEVIATQAEVHALFGGVVPEIASREHYRLLGPLYDELLAKTGVGPRDIDVVAVARGPGLLGCLLTGLGFAKGLALGLGARLVGVNHLHAHLLAPGLHGPIAFPALGLLVSGGHTHIYRIRSDTDFELLGRTLDDAAGEAYDKVAKMLNLPYPGGRFVDALGRRGTMVPDMFPRPYLENQNCDFSFSGLKTAVATHIAAREHLRFAALADPDAALAGQGVSQELADMCASFNHAVADTLRIKLQRAFDRVGPVASCIVAGGVAANSFVRGAMALLAAKNRVPLLLPPLELCTDNGAMIAYAGERLAAAGLFHGLELDAVPRGKPIPWDYEAGCRRLPGKGACVTA